MLTTISYYHKNESRLDLNHTINFGRPWREKSICEYGFISLPYLDGPELENGSVSNLKTMKFYWLIPITKGEMEFKKKCGYHALEEEFERESFNYLDVNRDSLV